MKKKILAITLAFTLIFVNAFTYFDYSVYAEDGEYTVSVSMNKLSGTISKKVANAINPTAQIVKSGNKYVYHLSFTSYKSSLFINRTIKGFSVQGTDVQSFEDGVATFELNQCLSSVTADIQSSGHISWSKVKLNFDTSSIPSDESNGGSSGNDNGSNDGNSGSDSSDNNSGDNHNNNDNSNSGNSIDDGSENVKRYKVPVKILKDGKNKVSMANKAIKHPVYVVEKDGRYQLNLRFKEIQMGPIKSGIGDFWVYLDNDYVKLDAKNVGGTYYNSYTVILDEKMEMLNAQFKIPVMPMKPKARIYLDWDKAELLDSGSNSNDDSNDNSDDDTDDDSNDDSDDNSNDDSNDNSDDDSNDNSENDSDDNSDEDEDDDANDDANDEEDEDESSADYEPEIEDVKDEEYKTMYKVPVYFKNVEGQESMAASALINEGTVYENDGEYTYFIRFVPMKKEFGGKVLEGKLTNLFYYQGSKKHASYHGNGKWSFTLDRRKNEIKMAVWVDVMDEIMGGNPGDGEQDVFLFVDWNEAEKEEYLASEDKEKEADADDKDKKEKEKSDKKTEKSKKEKKDEKPIHKKPKLIKAWDKRVSYEKFNDIVKRDWYADAVTYLYERNIMHGTSKSNFSPKTKTTRAMLTTILYNLEGEQEIAYKDYFKDVPKDKWYSKGVIWAAQNNIVNGFQDKLFKPNSMLSREQLVTILYKYSQRKGFDVHVKSNLKNYKDDYKLAKYAVEPMAWAVQNGLITGTQPNVLSPKKDSTRAELAVILQRYLKKYIE